MATSKTYGMWLIAVLAATAQASSTLQPTMAGSCGPAYQGSDHPDCEALFNIADVNSSTERLESMCHLSMVMSLCPTTCTQFTSEAEISFNVNASLFSTAGCACRAGCSDIPVGSEEQATTEAPPPVTTGNDGTLSSEHPDQDHLGFLEILILPSDTTHNGFTTEECLALCDELASEHPETCNGVFVGSPISDRVGECHPTPLNFSNSALQRMSYPGLRYFARSGTIQCFDECACSEVSGSGRQVSCINVNQGFPIIDDSVDNSTTVSFALVDTTLQPPILEADYFVGMTNLRFLTIRNCSLESIEPQAFDALTQLLSLDISSNNLGSIDAWISPLTSLVSLDMSHNSLPFISASVLSEVPRAVESLSLRGMSISRIVKGSFDKSVLPSLSNLELGANEAYSDQISNATEIIWESFCFVDVGGVRCVCATGYGSISATFCESTAPVLPAPDITSVMDTSIKLEIDFPLESALPLPDAVPSMSAWVAVFSCRSPDAPCATDPAETVELCCDQDCGAAHEVPKCAAFAALPTADRIVDVRNLPADTWYKATIMTNNEANVVVTGNYTSRFKTDIAQAAIAPSASDNQNIVIGITLALVAVLLVFTIVGKYAYRRMLRNRPVTREQMAALLEDIKTETTTEADKTNSSAKGQIASLPCEIPRRHVEVISTLGSGQFGDVCKAVISGWMGKPSFTVAMKTSKSNSSSAATELLTEAVLMSQFEHANVLSCVGIITRGGTTSVLIELSEYGDLRSFWLNNDLSKLLKAKDIFSIMLAVGKGCQHIASKGFVHRDLAARNVLVTSSFIFKVSDFGLSRELDRGDSDYYRSSTQKPMPLRWMAPEAFSQNRYSESSDVWSWAILGCEMFDDVKKPYRLLKDKEVWIKVKDGGFPDRPVSCEVKQWDNIFVPCFSMSPSQRPTFAKVTQRLKRLLGSDSHAATFKLLVGAENLYNFSQHESNTGSGSTSASTIASNTGSSLDSNVYEYDMVPEAQVQSPSCVEVDGYLVPKIDSKEKVGSSLAPGAEADGDGYLLPKSDSAEKVVMEETSKQKSSLDTEEEQHSYINDGLVDHHNYVNDVNDIDTESHSYVNEDLSSSRAGSTDNLEREQPMPADVDQFIESMARDSKTSIVLNQQWANAFNL